jgi:CHAD domain-containing protein
MQAVAEHKKCSRPGPQSGKLMKTLGVSRDVNQFQLAAQQYRSQLRTKDNVEFDRFEELMRLQAQNPKAAGEALRLQPFHQVPITSNDGLVSQCSSGQLA